MHQKHIPNCVLMLILQACVFNETLCHLRKITIDNNKLKKST